MKKELLILIGNIGTGKSTFVKSLVKKGFICVSRDGIRYSLGGGQYIFSALCEQAVKATVKKLALELVKSEVEKIVIDETNMSISSRSYYITLAIAYGYKCVAIVMPQLSMNDCVKRRLSNNHGAFTKEVWQEVWTNFSNRYEKPTLKEGFDKIVIKKDGR